MQINWSEYHHAFSNSHEVLSLPTYAFDDKVYWIEYKGDWTLTKGDVVQAAPAKPSFSTTAIQSIIHEEITADFAVIIGQSDFANPLLRQVIEGHQVNGVGLCPSTLYADMAMTLCDYAWRAGRPDGGKPHFNVPNMEHETTCFQCRQNQSTPGDSD